MILSALRKLPGITQLVTGVVLVVGMAGGVWYFGHTRYQAGYDKARGEWAAANEEAAGRFAAALQDQQTKLIETDAELTTARWVTSTIKESLDEALDTPAGDAWGDVRIPDDVRLSLNTARHSAMPGDPDEPHNSVRDP